MPLQASFVSRIALLAGTAIALPTLFACLDHPLKPVELEAASEDEEGIQITVNKDVDILFVIDNSGSMGEEQGLLSSNFPNFIAVLEDPEVKANYRIGVTTTDNGNPWCNTTSPEAGALRLTSCRSRQSEFIFSGTTMVDATQAACLDVCPDTWGTIDIQPTTTEVDPQPAPRLWMESIEGATNLPAGLDTTQAFQCFGPQGINGCGFESHLESMYKALVRAQNADEASYGFLRQTAILSIVIVTDEADCSYNDSHRDIFLPDGDKTFWTLPDEGSPTSAVCWNAGVECTGGGTPYDECHSVNLHADGTMVTGDPANDAVLRPVSRYIDLVQGLETAKKVNVPTQEVLIAAIAGVPEGYSAGSAEIGYSDTPADPAFQDDFGIGPGCETPPDAMGIRAARAVPPVRIREFAEAFRVGDQRNLYSVCASDYGPALDDIANAIRDQIKPACMPDCVADTDPTTRPADENCTLKQVAPAPDGGRIETIIAECGPGDALADGSDVCYVALTDKNGDTPDAGDDMSPECRAEGWNLEFRIVRREGVPAPGGTSVSATCQLSQQRNIDCPDLPG